MNATLDEISPGDYWSYVYGTITDDNDIRDYEMMVEFWTQMSVRIIQSGVRYWQRQLKRQNRRGI